MGIIAGAMAAIVMAMMFFRGGLLVSALIAPWLGSLAIIVVPIIILLFVFVGLFLGLTAGSKVPWF